MHLGPTKRSSSGDAISEQGVRLGWANATWPWFQEFCGFLMMLFYREVLRLMVWARAMNW